MWSDSPRRRSMWTLENRAKYNRDHLRYPSDLTDHEWAYVEPLIPPAKPGGGKRRTDMRAVMDGVMYILSTGCQWRYLPKDFPSYSTVHRYFVWWQCDGVLDRIHHALYVACREKAEREATPTAAIIDSQSVKSAEKGGPHRSAWLRCGQKDQGQEAPHPRRYAGFAASCHGAFRRHSGPRRRHLTSGDNERSVSFAGEAVRRQRLSRAAFCQGARQNPASSRNRDCQTFGSCQGVRAVTQALVVERTIAWLNRCRRLAKDWENLNRNALAFLKLASIRLMLRKWPEYGCLDRLY